MFIDSFIGYLRVERNYSAHTLRAYRSDLCSFQDYLARLDESISFLDVDVDIVRLWVAFMMDSGSSSASVCRKLSSLRAFYKYLCFEGVASENPLQNLQGPKCRKSLPVFVKVQDMDRLIDEGGFDDGYAGCRDRMILLCFYSTGMRLSELVGLDVDDVDMRSSVIKVLGKRSKERVIPFGAELRMELEAYLRQRDEFVVGDEKALFLSGGRNRISRSAVYRLVNRKLEEFTSLNKKSPHVLRHSFATAMLNNSAELGAVKELLGHKRLATTEIYTHLTFEELKQFYNKAHPRAGNN